MNLSWFLFYGRKLGMSKPEILVTPYGEMLDMLACSAIDQGAKQKRKPLSMESILFSLN